MIYRVSAIAEAVDDVSEGTSLLADLRSGVLAASDRGMSSRQIAAI